ncbi:sensor histidine kinase [Micromonospora sp. NPDC049559]|uniref:sensor histidine kinase n=1 Tax=Micromonospora sp. NPDC049559 TaxID=3155923 RepID=UPI00342EEA79
MSNSKPRTALESVARKRFPLTGWPWRSLSYLLTTAPLSFAVAGPVALVGLPWAALLRRAVTGGERPPSVTLLVLALFGVVLVAAFGPLVALPVAALERRRLRLVDERPARSGHRRIPEPGLWAWLRTRYTERATWSELGYLGLLATVVPALYGVVCAVLLVIGVLLASPVLAGSADGPISVGPDQVTSAGAAVPYALVGLVLLPTVPYLLALAAGAHAELARALLHAGPDERLRAELVEVSRSRVRLVDAFDAERRRIERDLHDGAQQRLVSLTLQLGLARLDLPPDSPANEAVAGAHEQAKQLMAELRELIDGIRPRTLADLGLPAALRELADRSTVTVRVVAELPERAPEQVETTAYFVVAEALTNAAKHSGATAATVTARREGDLLTVEVVDDGRGGAEPARGSGLTGLADRVAVVDGRMFLSSPVGGPTLLRVELPCGRR